MSPSCGEPLKEFMAQQFVSAVTAPLLVGYVVWSPVARLCSGIATWMKYELLYPFARFLVRLTVHV